jgi:hypothetical protein
LACLALLKRQDAVGKMKKLSQLIFS